MVFISVIISNETTSHCTYYYSYCLRFSRYQTIICNRAVQRDNSYELTLALYYYWVLHISFSYYLLTIYLAHVHWPVLATWSSPISFSSVCNMFETQSHTLKSRPLSGDTHHTLPASYLFNGHILPLSVQKIIGTADHRNKLPFNAYHFW